MRIDLSGIGVVDWDGFGDVNYLPDCFSKFYVYNLQKLKSHVVKQSVNPEWDEDLTLSISDPNLPIKLVSFYYQFHFPNMGFAGMYSIISIKIIFQF